MRRKNIMFVSDVWLQLCDGHANVDFSLLFNNVAVGIILLHLSVRTFAHEMLEMYQNSSNLIETIVQFHSALSPYHSRTKCKFCIKFFLQVSSSEPPLEEATKVSNFAHLLDRLALS